MSLAQTQPMRAPLHTGPRIASSGLFLVHHYRPGVEQSQ